MTGKDKEREKKKWKSLLRFLADTVNGFAFCLDRLALKKSSNSDVYEHIKKSFDEELATEEFIDHGTQFQRPWNYNTNKNNVRKPLLYARPSLLNNK